MKNHSSFNIEDMTKLENKNNETSVCEKLCPLSFISFYNIGIEYVWYVHCIRNIVFLFNLCEIKSFEATCYIICYMLSDLRVLCVICLI